MRIFRAKKNFTSRIIIGGVERYPMIFTHQAFIVDDINNLPLPLVGGTDKYEEFFEEIVPKNILIKLDSFVKVKAL